MNNEDVLGNLAQSKLLLNQIVRLNEEIAQSKTKERAKVIKKKLDLKIFCLRVVLDNLIVDIDLSIENQIKGV